MWHTKKVILTINNLSHTVESEPIHKQWLTFGQTGSLLFRKAVYPARNGMLFLVYFLVEISES